LYTSIFYCQKLNYHWIFYNARLCVDFQPKHLPLTQTEKDEAESLKRQGNDHMKEEKYDKAIECYSKAIAIDNENAAYHCNRY